MQEVLRKGLKVRISRRYLERINRKYAQGYWERINRKYTQAMKG